MGFWTFTFQHARRWALGLLVPVGLVIAGLFIDAVAVSLEIGGVVIDEEWRDTFAAFNRAPVEVVHEARTYRFSPAALGVQVDLAGVEAEIRTFRRLGQWGRLLAALRRGAFTDVRELPLQLDPTAFEETVIFLSRQLDVPARNARFRYADGTRSIESGEPGQRLNVAAFARDVRRAVQQPDGLRVVQMELVTVRPAVDEAGLRRARFEVVLGSSETHFDPSASGRTQNIQTAARMVDGIVVASGGQFSLNGITGPRTLEHGYAPAPVIYEGEVTEGVGGGVSQFSSAVFNAALLSGMEILEHHNHSLPVSYMPLGRDATVWYGSLDLRFRNPWEGLVLVRSEVHGDTLQVQLLGETSPFTGVEIATEIVQEIPPPPGVPVPGPGGQAGDTVVVPTAPRPGYVVHTIQQVLRDDEVLRAQTLRSYYPPYPRPEP